MKMSKLQAKDGPVDRPLRPPEGVAGRSQRRGAKRSPSAGTNGFVSCCGFGTRQQL